MNTPEQKSRFLPILVPRNTCASGTERNKNQRFWQFSVRGDRINEFSIQNRQDAKIGRLTSKRPNAGDMERYCMKRLWRASRDACRSSHTSSRAGLRTPSADWYYVWTKLLSDRNSLFKEPDRKQLRINEIVLLYMPRQNSTWRDLSDRSDLIAVVSDGMI